MDAIFSNASGFTPYSRLNTASLLSFSCFFFSTPYYTSFIVSEQAYYMDSKKTEKTPTKEFDKEKNCRMKKR
jgi:hypothetical protein